MVLNNKNKLQLFFTVRFHASLFLSKKETEISFRFLSRQQGLFRLCTLDFHNGIEHINHTFMLAGLFILIVTLWQI